MKIVYMLPVVAYVIASSAVVFEGYSTRQAQYNRTLGYVVSQLKDPESAKMRNVKYVTEWVACGEIDAKNSFGGYTGYKQFVVAAENVAFEGDVMYAVLRKSCE